MTPTALPWLLGIATHLVRDHARAHPRQMRALSRILPEPPLDEYGATVDRLDAEALISKLNAALSSLRREDRELVLLIAVGGLSYGEAGAMLGIPSGTVRSRLSRARARLAKHFPERNLA